MIRQGLFWAIVLLLFAATWSVRGFDPTNRPTDEILAYEVTERQSVEVMLHGGVEDITITAWLLVPPSKLNAGPFPYSLRVQYYDPKGRSVHERTYDTVGQLPAEESPSPSQIAQLADGTALVAEPRTLHLDSVPLQGQAGRLRVSAPAGTPHRVLLRLAHRVPRSDIERQLLERTLSPEARTQLTSGRTSLGFFDMPETVRNQSLSHWQRRLSAAGRQGRDYITRRLLLRDPELRSNLPMGRGQASLVSRDRGLSYAIASGVSLRVYAATSCRLWLSTTHSPQPTYHDVKAGASVELQVEDRGLSSVFLHAEPETEVWVSAAPEQRSAFVSGDHLPLVAGRLQLQPDYRSLVTYRLDDRSPLLVSIAPHQQHLGIAARVLGDAPSSPLGGTVSFVDAQGQQLTSTPFDYSFEASSLEQADGKPVSHASRLRFHVPQRAATALIHGSRDLLVRPFIAQSAFDETRYLPPYEQPLPEGLVWRYASTQLPHLAMLRPDNWPSLREQQREVSVSAQVRIERAETRAGVLPAKVLTAREPLAAQYAFSPSYYAPRFPFPRNGWILWSQDRPERSILPLGEPPWLELSYRADPQHHAPAWSVTLEGNTLLSEALLVDTGERGVMPPAEGGRLTIEGLGPRGRAVVHAKPKGGGRFVKRQLVYWLPPGQELDFEFLQRPGQLLKVVIGVLTTSGNANVVLEHRVDAGKRPKPPGVFRVRPTLWRGRHSLRTGARGRALLWDARLPLGDEPLPDRLGSLLIPLGDDLPRGPHTFTVRNATRRGPQDNRSATRNQTWIRAVLVGRDLSAP